MVLSSTNFFAISHNTCYTSVLRLVSCFINQIVKLINKIKMEQKIKSVEKGWGEDSTFFSTDQTVSEAYRVDVIKEEQKQIGNNILITVYRGYKNGNLFFEMGASIDVTVAFFA